MLHASLWSCSNFQQHIHPRWSYFIDLKLAYSWFCRALYVQNEQQRRHGYTRTHAAAVATYFPRFVTAAADETAAGGNMRGRGTDATEEQLPEMTFASDVDFHLFAAAAEQRA